MKKFFIALVIASLAAAFLSAWADSPKQCTKNGECGISSKDPTKQDIVVDPVCGMDVVVNNSQYQSKFNGKTYHFCSLKCKRKFDKNPSRFIGKEHKKK
ncbi:MAG: YHS domain-containing protein [Nitrospirota bacterium]